MLQKKQTHNAKVQNEVVKELKEGAEGLDIVSIGVDVQGLVLMINEHNIKMFDDVEYTMVDVIKNIIESRASFNSFFLIDIGAIFRRYKLWMQHMPRVKMFYAVKCNPDKLLLNTLVDLGVGFDVASKMEISTVREFAVDPKRIIFANPVKENNHISYAESEGILKMTFDSVDELKKISVFHPNAELVLRILVDDSKSKLPFGSKFGCPKKNLPVIFDLAKTLNLNIIGVSFHVGSACEDSNTYADAIIQAREVFDIAKEHGFDMRLLDLGGGYGGDDNKESDNKFIETTRIINETIEKYFSDIRDLEIIAEPGRFIATSVGTLVTNIIGKKVIIDDEGNKIIHYYINSNIYGMFNNIIFDKATPVFELLKPIIEDQPLFKSVIFGNTCDAGDRLIDNIKLPELSIGTWFIIRNFGSYTYSAGSKFNGFDLADIIYIFTY